MDGNVLEFSDNLFHMLTVAGGSAALAPLRLQFLMRMAKYVHEVVVHIDLRTEVLFEFIDARLRNISPHTQNV